MKNIYLGYIPKEIESFKFELDILDKIKDENDKITILKFYEKIYEKNIYKMKETVNFENREKIREILEKIGY